MKKNPILDEKMPIVLHIAAWTIVLVLPLYLLGSTTGQDKTFLYRIYSHLTAYAVLFYVNYIWLIPKFFFRDKKLLYFISAILAIIGFFALVQVVNTYIIPGGARNLVFEQKLMRLLNENHIQPPKGNIFIFNYLLNSVLVCGFSFGLRLSQKYYENEKARKELERAQLNTELAFLKNQISPHFFFNTLNNIYSLIQINADDAQNSVLKLSKLMRYLLYESEQGHTRLSREIEFMKNYIDLMRLRLNNKVSVIVSFPDNYTDAEISPLLFISFIENAFKHGISYNNKSFIYITLVVDHDEIHFSCQNSINESDEKKENASGIGLENIRKRLALLYPQKHELSISKKKEAFNVLLIIKTK